MAFQQLGPPSLPFPEQAVHLLQPAALGVAHQQRRGRRRRAGAPIRLDHVRLAPGEQLVQHRQVADHHGDEADAEARLQHGDQAAAVAVRHHVAVAQGEEGDAAHVELLEIRRVRAGPNRLSQ